MAFSIGRHGGRDRQYLICLLTLSMIFYGWHISGYLLLFFPIVLLHYSAARLIHSQQIGRIITFILSSVLLANMTVLTVFKYADPLLDSILRPVGINTLVTTNLPESFDIALPIGISFYTF